LETRGFYVVGSLLSTVCDWVVMREVARLELKLGY